MSLRFWTTLQLQKQAVLVEDGKIVKAIPPHPPKTMWRRVAVITEYKKKLALIRQASFELWSRDGMRCFVSFPHKLIYTPHDIIQVGDDVLICSSGLDMFFLMDIKGNIKWEWWGHENGIGAKSHYFESPDWEMHQATSDLCAPPIEESAHFNSIWMKNEDTFITAALRKQKVGEITIGKDHFKLIADVKSKGCHSPFFYNYLGTEQWPGDVHYETGEQVLIYGTEAGIQVGRRQRMMQEFGWVKYVRPFEDGFAFAHEKGIAIADGSWKLKENIPLPPPYKFAYMERIDE